jgi:hypothetical protein
MTGGRSRRRAIVTSSRVRADAAIGAFDAVVGASRASNWC